MRRALAALALAVSVACGPGRESAANEDAKKKTAATEEKDEPNWVKLDRAQEAAARLTTERVEEREVAGSVTAPGQLTVNEDRTWRAGAVAAGKVEEVLAKVGDRVAAGQTLARIHSHDVHDARASFVEAQVEERRARGAAAIAEERRNRAARLLQIKAGSRQDVESAETGLIDAKAKVAAAEAEVEKERIHLTDVLHVSVEGGHSGAGKGEEDSSDAVPIFAPGGGVVMERQVGVGSVVATGDNLFTITDTASVWMIAAANEADLRELRAGQAASIAVRAYPDRAFAGRVLKLGEQLDATTRTLEVRIAVPNAGGLLKPQMFATAEIANGRARRVMAVEETALQDINGVQAVFVCHEGGRYEARTIKAGQRWKGRVDVTDGLKAGERIVTQGSFTLKSQLLKRTLEEE